MLGLALVEDSPGWIRLDTGGVVLALHELRGEPVEAAPAARQDTTR